MFLFSCFKVWVKQTAPPLTGCDAVSEQQVAADAHVSVPPTLEFHTVYMFRGGRNKTHPLL